MVGRYRMKDKHTCMFDDVLTHSHHRCIPFVTYQDTRIVDSTISENSEFAYHSVDERYYLSSCEKGDYSSVI